MCHAKSKAESTENLMTLEKTYFDREKESLPLSSLEQSTLVGIMLGDGHLQTQNMGKTFRLMVSQGGVGTVGEAHREYVYHLYDIFSNFCLQKPRKLVREDALSNNPRWLFHTKASGQFTDLAKQFYKPLSSFSPDLKKLYEERGKGKGQHEIHKVGAKGKNNKTIQGNRLIKVCPQGIKELLDERALSYWYMDDGSQKDPKSGACILNTQAFTLKECILLCEVLKERFSLDSQIRYKARLNRVFGHQIYIKSNNNRFLQLVQPYYLHCMRYKLPKVVKSRKVRLL